MAGDLMGKAADWAFTKRFRRGGFDWRASRLASERIAEALAEIHAVARHDPLHAADGAVRLLVKLSPALEQVDSSSGALGSAARAAVDTADRSLLDELSPVLDVLADRVADEVVRLSQAGEGTRIREAALLHHDRGLDVQRVEIRFW